MSDQRLRKSEAAWRASGSVADEAAWLLERVRAGELPREKLELAAYCGHEAASEALGESAPIPHKDPSIFAATLTKWGPDTALRSLLATATDVGKRYSIERPDRRRAINLLLRSLDAWVVCPCRQHLRELKRSVTKAACLREDEDDEGYLGPSVDEVATFVLRLAESVSNTTDPKGALITMAVRFGVAALPADLVPWALGYSDPVRERVELRPQETARG